MRTKLHLIILLLALGLPAQVVLAQDDTDQRPVVTLLGEDEALLTDLTTEYPEMLLTVCGNNMEFAFEKWMEMLGAMEDLSEELDFDIKGVKVYLQVFWNADGSIAHLSFFPKTISRNVPHAELKAFFAEFAKDYKLPVTFEEGFSHYGSASFPTFTRPEYNVRRDD